MPILPRMPPPAFNRLLAKHLAKALKAGAECDHALVLRCHATARRDVMLPPGFASDPLALEIQALCITHDLQVLRQNRNELVKLSLADAEARIFRLLNADLRVRSP